MSGIEEPATCSWQEPADFVSVFPEELVVLVFAYLGHEKLCLASAVSRNWRRLANDEILWKDLCFRLSRVVSLSQNWRLEFRSLFEALQLQFCPRPIGRNIELSNEGRTARRTRGFRHAVVFGRAPLVFRVSRSLGESVRCFEIEVDEIESHWAGSLEIGVTRVPPEFFVSKNGLLKEYPKHLMNIPNPSAFPNGSTWKYDCGHTFFVDGQSYNASNSPDAWRDPVDPCVVPLRDKDVVAHDKMGVLVESLSISWYRNGGCIGKYPLIESLDNVELYLVVEVYGKTKQVTILDTEPMR